MRTITEEGRQRIYDGFVPFNPPIEGTIKFWEWASMDGSAFQHAACFVLGALNAWGSEFRGLAMQSRREKEELLYAHH